MGSALFEVGEVLGARGNTKAKKIRSGGTLYVRITPAPVTTGTLHLNMRGIKIKNTEGMFGKSDPFLEMSAKVEAAGGLTWQPVYRSLPVMNNLDPNWPPFSVELARLCDGDLDKPILIQIWDWQKNGRHTSIGTFETTVNSLVARAIAGADGGPSRGIDMSKAFPIADKKGKNAGHIVVTTAKVEGTAMSMSSTMSASPMQVPLRPLVPPPAAPVPAHSNNIPEFSQALNRPPPSFSTAAVAISAAGTMSSSRISSPSPGSVAPMVPPAPSQYGNLPPPMAPPSSVTSQFHPKPSLKPQFVDYLTGGCELELSIAIDFTGSNGDPRIPGTLHYQHHDGQLNDYEKAITAVGGILSKYDFDQKYPCFGFGAKYDGVVRHSFQVGAKPELDGISGVLEAYRNVFRTGLTMSGPTVFAEVISYAAAMARSTQEASRNIGKQSYRVLLILTDGAVTDMEQTKEAISAASDAPLSVVIVGIGNADFTAMQELDDFMASAARDIVQFVKFSDHAHDRSSLTKATLEEIPNQLVDYFYSRGVKPLPPISGSQLSLYPEEATDEDIDLSLDLKPNGEICVSNYSATGYNFDDTKYNTLSDYSSVVPVPPPVVPPPQQPSTASYYQQQAAPQQPEVFYVQVPPGIDSGMQLQIQHPKTNQQMIVTVPQGVGPGGKFAVRY